MKVNIVLGLMVLFINYNCNQNIYGNLYASKDGVTIRQIDRVNIIIKDKSNLDLDSVEGKYVLANIKARKSINLTEKDRYDKYGQVRQIRLGNQRTINLVHLTAFPNLYEKLSEEEAAFLNNNLITNPPFNFQEKRILFVSGNNKSVISKDEFFKNAEEQLAKNGKLIGTFFIKVDSTIDNKGFDGFISIWNKTNIPKNRQIKILKQF